MRTISPHQKTVIKCLWKQGRSTIIHFLSPSTGRWIQPLFVLADFVILQLYQRWSGQESTQCTWQIHPSQVNPLQIQVRCPIGYWSSDGRRQNPPENTGPGRLEKRRARCRWGYEWNSTEKEGQGLHRQNSLLGQSATIQCRCKMNFSAMTILFWDSLNLCYSVPTAVSSNPETRNFEPTIASNPTPTYVQKVLDWIEFFLIPHQLNFPFLLYFILRQQPHLSHLWVRQGSRWYEKVQLLNCNKSNTSVRTKSIRLDSSYFNTSSTQYPLSYICHTT